MLIDGKDILTVAVLFELGGEPMGERFGDDRGLPKTPSAEGCTAAPEFEIAMANRSSCAAAHRAVFPGGVAEATRAPSTSGSFSR